MAQQLASHEGSLITAVFREDCKSIATCGEDGHIRVWRLPAAVIAAAATASGIGAAVATEAAPALNLIASASVAGLSLPGAVRGQHGAWITRVAFAPDGSFVLGAAGRALVACELPSSSFAASSPTPAAPKPIIVALMPDVAEDLKVAATTNTVYACAFNGLLSWPLAKLRQQLESGRHATEVTAAPSKLALGAAAAARAPRAAARAGTPKEPAPAATTTPARVFATKGVWAKTLALSPDGAWAAAACSDDTVHLWRLSNGEDMECSGWFTILLVLAVQDRCNLPPAVQVTRRCPM